MSTAQTPRSPVRCAGSSLKHKISFCRWAVDSTAVAGCGTARQVVPESQCQHSKICRKVARRLRRWHGVRLRRAHPGLSSGSRLLGPRCQRDIVIRFVAVRQRSRAQHVGLHHNSASSVMPLLHDPSRAQLGAQLLKDCRCTVLSARHLADEQRLANAMVQGLRWSRSRARRLRTLSTVRAHLPLVSGPLGGLRGRSRGRLRGRLSPGCWLLDDLIVILLQWQDMHRGMLRRQHDSIWRVRDEGVLHTPSASCDLWPVSHLGRLVIVAVRGLPFPRRPALACRPAARLAASLARRGPLPGRRRAVGPRP